MNVEMRDGAKTLKQMHNAYVLGKALVMHYKNASQLPSPAGVSYVGVGLKFSTMSFYNSVSLSLTLALV